jgi:adenosylcobinamide-phosphate synthase
LSILLTIFALTLDTIIGDPQNWPHPVRLIGYLICTVEWYCRLALERLKGRDKLYLLFGAFLAILVVSLTGLIVWLSLYFSGLITIFLWFITVLYLTFTIFCLKDLTDHVKRVEKALELSDLDEARRALSWIVGRDTVNLSPDSIRRALVETIAENFADGLVAPLFYLALGGPVLAWAYKAINTLDSMVGYKNERYLYLGRFSARLDDLANYIPARLAALLLIVGAKLLGLDWANSYKLWRKEGRFHSSPNSGQTEAAMAGALNVYLGGPNYYGGLLVEKPYIGQNLANVTENCVGQAIKLVRTSTWLTLILAVIIEAAILLIFEAPFGWGLNF